MKLRLQKILSDRGVASRRKAEELIRGGLVTVNGTVAALGSSADPDLDQIAVEGKPIPSATSYIYIMLNKPRGYVTTVSDERGRATAASLVEDCGQRVYPVGRLDMDSEGLLLFTNDGAFANRAMHPSHEIPKTYLVRVSDYTPERFQKLHEPVRLDGYPIKPPRLRLLRADGSRADLEIIIHEGRNRQIRRMCQIAGMRVLRLKRVKEGNLELGSLPPGQWRYLTPEEWGKFDG